MQFDPRVKLTSLPVPIAAPTAKSSVTQSDAAVHDAQAVDPQRLPLPPEGAPASAEGAAPTQAQPSNVPPVVIGPSSPLVPYGDLHDVAQQAVPMSLSRLPAARDVALQTKVDSIAPSIFAMACVEALHASQQPGGPKAVQDYAATVQSPQLKAALLNFVHTNAKAPAADAAGNFSPSLLKAATAALPPQGVAAAPAKPTPAAVAQKPAASPPVAKPMAASAPAAKPIAASAPAVKPPAIKTTVAKPPVTTQNYLSLIAAIPAASRPGNHSYTYDVASVLGHKDPSFDFNDNPSADQYVSFMYTLFQSKTPSTGQANPALARFLIDEINQRFPSSTMSKPISTGMLERIAEAQKKAGYTDPSVPPTPDQQSKMRENMTKYLASTFQNSGYILRAPHLNTNYLY